MCLFKEEISDECLASIEIRLYSTTSPEMNRFELSGIEMPLLRWDLQFVEYSEGQTKEERVQGS